MISLVAFIVTISCGIVKSIHGRCMKRSSHLPGSTLSQRSHRAFYSQRAPQPATFLPSCRKRLCILHKVTPRPVKTVAMTNNTNSVVYVETRFLNSACFSILSFCCSGSRSCSFSVLIALKLLQEQEKMREQCGIKRKREKESAQA